MNPYLCTSMNMLITPCQTPQHALHTETVTSAWVSNPFDHLIVYSSEAPAATAAACPLLCLTPTYYAVHKGKGYAGRTSRH